MIGRPTRFKRPAIGELPNLLVDEQFRQSVTFLYVDVVDNDSGQVRRSPAGTAFFVSALCDPPKQDLGVVYVVTARHVIEQARPYGPLYLREVSPHGDIDDSAISPDSWVEHKSDVAIARVRLRDWEVPEVKWIQSELFVTAAFVAAQQVGLGDELTFVGLFSPAPGTSRPQPVVRFGNIARMPTEPVAVEITPNTPVEIEAYLVEGRSWGGQSGSPVFLYLPTVRRQGRGWYPEFSLLGLIHGHHPHEVIADFGPGGKAKVDINAGILVVVPAQAILDLLGREDVVKERNEICQRAGGTAQGLPTADSAVAPEETEFERFESLTRSVVNVPKTEIVEKRKDES